MSNPSIRIDLELPSNERDREIALADWDSFLEEVRKVIHTYHKVLNLEEWEL